MKIIPVHHNISQEVLVWPQIEKAAKELREFATKGPFYGEHRGCYALHHAQVDEKPFNFFCLSEDGAKQLPEFPHWCIINPQVIAKAMPFRPIEGCMSWPHRKAKKVDRYLSVVVRFQYPKRYLLSYKLETFEGPIEKLAAHVFQHEADHGKGKTICD